LTRSQEPSLVHRLGILGIAAELAGDLFWEGTWYFMAEHSLILNAAAIQRALTRMAHEIAERNETAEEIALVGIQRGGLPCAQRLSAILADIWGRPVATGALDVSMHRDDLDRRVAPTVQPTIIPFDVTGKTVVLVDDVLYSGRTIRCSHGCVERLWPAQTHPIGGPGRSRTP